jgi:hypothetical protein
MIIDFFKKGCWLWKYVLACHPFHGVMMIYPSLAGIPLLRFACVRQEWQASLEQKLEENFQNSQMP